MAYMAYELIVIVVTLLIICIFIFKFWIAFVYILFNYFFIAQHLLTFVF